MPAMPFFVMMLAQPMASAQAPAMGRDISRHLSGQQMIPVQWIMVAAGLLLLLISSLSLYRLWRTRDQRSTPLLVFHRLAKQFGLSLRDQWLLYRIARQQTLPTPLTLMLARDTLEHHARAYAQGHTSARAQTLSQHIDTIAHTLFGDAPTTR